MGTTHGAVDRRHFHIATVWPNSRVGFGPTLPSSMTFYLHLPHGILKQEIKSAL